MKKLVLTLTVAVCLLFSVAVTSVRADGDGHDAGYICVKTETVACPPDTAALPQRSETSGSNTEAAEKEDATLNLLEFVITLILKS